MTIILGIFYRRIFDEKTAQSSEHTQRIFAYMEEILQISHAAIFAQADHSSHLKYMDVSEWVTSEWLRNFPF